MSYYPPPYGTFFPFWNPDHNQRMNYFQQTFRRYPYQEFYPGSNLSYQPQQSIEYEDHQKNRLQETIKKEETLKIEAVQEKQPSPVTNVQKEKKTKLKQALDRKQKKTIRFSKQVLIKSFNDDDFKINQRKKEQNHLQKEGRNRNSNLFRAFIKLLASKSYHQILEQKYKKIIQATSIKIPFETFILTMENKAPTFTNYINNKEFQKLYYGEREFNQIIRILFQQFRKDEGLTHILTVNYKNRMKKESIKEFLETLHDIDIEPKKKRATSKR